MWNKWNKRNQQQRQHKKSCGGENHCFQIFSDIWHSRPLAVTVVFFALGIALGNLFLPGKMMLTGLVAGAFLCLFLAFFKKWHTFLLIVACLLGVFWFSMDYQPRLEAAKPAAGSRVAVTGRIVDMVSRSNSQYTFILEPEDSYHWQGNAMVYAMPGDYAYGDVVKVTGKIAKSAALTNPGGFDYEKYLLRQGTITKIYATYNGSVTPTGENRGNALMAFAMKLKDRIEANLATLPDQQKNYMVGILFGDKTGLDKSDKAILSQTGIMHVFAVSGLHIGFILLLGTGLARLLKLKRWLYALVATLPVLLYCMMAGFTPSVTRAFIMCIVGMLAFCLGEEKDGWTALAVAFGVCLIWQPQFLFDIGFQLSFLAIAGMFYLTPAMEKLFPKKGFWGKALATAMAAQLATIPITAYNFHVVTLLGILLSPLAVFAAGITVIAGLLSLPISLLGLDVPFLHFAGTLVQGMVNVAAWCNQVPLAWRRVATPGVLSMALYYVLCLFIPYLTKKKLPRTSLLTCLALALFFMTVSVHSTGNLKVTYLDVGQGTAIVIETPGNQQILIDGGGGSGQNLSSTGYNIILPYLAQEGVTDVETIINTHPHSDHMGGLLAVMKSMPVDLLLTGEGFQDIELQKELISASEEENIPWQTIGKGTTLYLEQNITMEVLAPDDPGAGEVNDDSLVMLLHYGDTDFLFTGDAGEEVLEGLPLDAPQDIEVVEMAHHGSKDSFSQHLYDAFLPQAVMISVGANNSYGHPAAVVIQYWRDREIPVYRTDEMGAVTFISDGQTLQVDTYLQ